MQQQNAAGRARIGSVLTLWPRGVTVVRLALACIVANRAQAYHPNVGGGRRLACHGVMGAAHAAVLALRAAAHLSRVAAHAVSTCWHGNS